MPVPGRTAANGYFLHSDNPNTGMFSPIAGGAVVHGRLDFPLMDAAAK